jgi:hypothetical protein
MGSTIDIVTTFYVTNCPAAGCGITFAVEDVYDARRRVDGKSFYCPNGHTMSYHESEADRLRKQLETAQRRQAAAEGTVTHLRDQLEMSERSARALRGVNTRMRKRIADGVCPCCQRTFANLARHMAGQHPDYASTDQAEDGR